MHVKHSNPSAILEMEVGTPFQLKASTSCILLRNTAHHDNRQVLENFKNRAPRNVLVVFDIARFYSQFTMQSFC